MTQGMLQFSLGCRIGRSFNYLAGSLTLLARFGVYLSRTSVISV